MRVCLFCENRYAIDILSPLAEEAERRGYPVLWYIHAPKISDFPLKESLNWTSSIADVMDFVPEAVFVPGNIVPYYLPGVKIQVFHGYAAEKKDHWIIRRYFDTYFTQGPYFTSHFKASADKYGDFEVVETGWTKQDWIKHNLHTFDKQRLTLLREHGDKKMIVLYAPTFSPKLTSLPKIRPALEKMLEERPDVLLLMKFHPLTRQQWVDEYRQWAESRDDVIFLDKSNNVSEVELMSDLLVSDTSSVVYEFLLLDRPVVTLDTIAKEIFWENITDPSQLSDAVSRAFNDPESIRKRRWIVENYDPYMDGKCCSRMLDAAQDYINRHGVPRKRKLNLWRKYTSIKTFGRFRPIPESAFKPLV